MKKDLSKFLEEMETLEENISVMLQNLSTLLKGPLSKEEKEKAILSLFQRWGVDKSVQYQIRQKLKGTEFSNLIKESKGEYTMAANKKTNLDMFLEGVEDVEVSKKPRFHSIHRLYEATELDEAGPRNKSHSDDVEDDQDQADQGGGVNSNRNRPGSVKDDEPNDDQDLEEGKKKDVESEEPEAEEPEAEEPEGEDHESGEGEGEEEAEHEAGDDDEQGGEDESPDTDDEKSDMDEGAGEDILRALGSDPITGAKELFDMFVSKLTAVIGEAKAKSEAKRILDTMKQQQQQRKAAKPGMPKAPPSSVPTPKQEEEIQEAFAAGYAAGLKGVRKDAGAKSLKSGTNKVPTPKMAITGDKKLLKKPTTLKGDSYPNSSVAGKKGCKK